MQKKHSTPRRRFAHVVAALFGTRPAPVDPPPALSGFIHGESAQDRLERIYADALELCRRAYAGQPYSRRAMGELKMGPRRWQSAYLMLQRASVLDDNGALIHPEQVMARRALYACREHFTHAMRQGQYTLPF